MALLNNTQKNSLKSYFLNFCIFLSNKSKNTKNQQFCKCFIFSTLSVFIGLVWTQLSQDQAKESGGTSNIISRFKLKARPSINAVN